MKASDARTHGYLTVGEAAEVLGTTPRTLLYYEEEGLVRPRRSDRGTRFYSEFDLRRLDVCLRLSCLAFPLRTIKQLALTRSTAQTGDESSHALVKTIEQMRERCLASIVLLRSLVHALDEAEVRISGCYGCPYKPTKQSCPHCPCETNLLDDTYLLHLIRDLDRPSPVDERDDPPPSRRS